MTDIAVEGAMPMSKPTESIHTDTDARKRLSRRYAVEARFKYAGLCAVLIACGFLVVLLSTVVGQAINAFTSHYASVEVSIPAVDGSASQADRRSAMLNLDFNGVVRDAVRREFPSVSGRKDRRALNGLLSSGAGTDLRRQVLADPAMAGTTAPVAFLLSDFGDLYLKGEITGRATSQGRGIAVPVQSGSDIEIRSTQNDFRTLLAEIKGRFLTESEGLRNDSMRLGRIENRLIGQITAAAGDVAEAPAADRAGLARNKASLEHSLASIQADRANIDKKAGALEARAAAADQPEQLTSELPSYIVRINGGAVKVSEVDGASVRGRALLPLDSLSEAGAETWSVERLAVPESSRKLSDQEIVWVDRLVADGAVERRINSVFFTAGASREPEQAGIWGAVVGTFYTMLVTLVLSFPVGVAAAIYLEEFAPKNRLTDLIEVNINNLAAVPSIVFGLLGLAVFLNFFGLPRSAPVVGGMVLALMTLPTIIIASRAALKAVPPSIREAALGVGASRLQAVFHHVLPLAMPGILTGAIIGMAQALGETAPLLMIGMVAFIVDIPAGPFDPATVLPVQIYMWADFPEPAFRQKTAAAILVLLGFLIAMNLIAVILRRRFERRW